MKIKRLDIRRMPGFPNGMKGLDSLAGNINVIAGPNGSGKSSIARVMQKLIWWDRRTTGYIVDAAVEVDGEQQEISIDAQSYIRHDSSNRSYEDFSSVSPPEFSNQYMLALHDLVNESDDELAKVIAREIHGGIDLKKAGADLGFKSNPPTTNHPAYRTYQAALQNLNRCEQEQDELKRAEQKLELLRQDQKAAEEARLLKELYEKYSDFLRENDERTLQQTIFAQYPEAMKQLREDDLQQIETLARKIKEIEQALVVCERAIASGRQELKQLRIPEEEIPGEQMNELAAKIEALKQVSKDRIAVGQEIERSKTERDAVNSLRIAGDATSADLQAIRLPDVAYWNEFVRKADEVEGECRDLANRISRTEKEKDTLLRNDSQERLWQKDIHAQDHLQKEMLRGPFQYATSQSELLIRGIHILSDWLKQKAHHRSTFPVWIWCLPAAGMLAAVLGFYYGLTGLLIGVVLSILLIPLIWLMQKRDQQERLRERQFREADYEKSGLDAPEDWNSEAVIRRMAALQKQLEMHIQYGLREKQLSEQLRLLHDEFAGKKSQLDKIRNEYVACRGGMGVLPPELDVLLADYDTFFLFINDLSRWQEAVVALEKSQRQKEQLDTQRQELLERINALLHRMHYEPVDDDIQAAAVLQRIREEREKRKDTLREIENQKNIIELKEKEKNDYQDALTGIYLRLGVAEGDENEVHLLSAQRKAYTKAKVHLQESEARLNMTKKNLEEHPLYASNKEEITCMTQEEVGWKIEEVKNRAEGLEAIIRSISEIEVRVKNTMSGNKLEVALEEKEAAIEKLNELFGKTMESVTGDLLMSALQQEISLNNENKVFKHANQLLGFVTQGKYSLTLGEGVEPEFRAMDHIRNRSLALNEISAGTRVQLLLAIRLAYVETQENAVRLPIMADELLANSDDERSEAMIEALIAISRNRQLFYFTAQADEVWKWRQYMEKNPDLSSAIILLGEESPEEKSAMGISGKETTDRKFQRSASTAASDGSRPEIKQIRLVREAPSPEGMSDQAYRKMLNFTAFRLSEQPVAVLHLWYLLDNPATLYHCLKLGFSRWGQLDNFLENGGSIPGIDRQHYEKIKEKIRILERFQKLYNEGRPRKIDREALIQSGAVSDAYLDTMTNWLTDTGNDPQALLDALDRGEIKGFRRNKKEELRIWLLENDYISDTSSLTEDEIMIRLNALISSGNTNPQEIEQFLNRVLGDS